MIQKLIIGLLLAGVVLVPLERLLALKPGARLLRPGWTTDLAHFFINALLTKSLVKLSAIAVFLLLRPLSWPQLKHSVAALPVAAQFGLALLVIDLVAYWIHRMAHEIPFLWRFHAIHHSSPHLDWLASVRLHPVDQVLIRTFQFVPLLLLGFSKETFGWYVPFGHLYALFIHSNVRVSFGPLAYVFATPHFHHWHHSDEPGHDRQNYAGQFPFWDMLFGTFYLPPGQWPAQYGVRDPVPVQGYLAQLAWPFVKKAPSPQLGRGLGRGVF